MFSLLTGRPKPKPVNSQGSLADTAADLLGKWMRAVMYSLGLEIWIFGGDEVNCTWLHRRFVY